MSRKSMVINVFLLKIMGILAVSFYSCEYEFAEFDSIDPTNPVSFVADIEPIFSNGNNCTACHRAGATSPDLTSGNAYQSIVPGLVNTGDPESSKIYVVPNPASSGHGFKKYTHEQAGLVLAWIKQGALDN
jgi:hypothetical protein